MTKTTNTKVDQAVNETAAAAVVAGQDKAKAPGNAVTLKDKLFGAFKRMTGRA